MKVFHRLLKKKKREFYFYFIRATAITIPNGKRETSFTLGIWFDDVTRVLTEGEVSNFFRPAP